MWNDKHRVISGDPELNVKLLGRWNMSSKYENSNNKNLSTENLIDDSIKKSTPCARATRLSTSHHVRHHSYDTTSNKIATQIFPPPRSNRKEDNLNNTNEHHHSHFLPLRSSHRHTSSFASDRSTFTNLNSNYYRQQNYSASQENLQHSDVNSSTLTSNSLKYAIPSKLPSTAPLTPSSSTTLTTAPTISTTLTSNLLNSSLSHINNNKSSSSSNSSTILNHFNIHNAKLICLLFFFALLLYHGSLRYIKGATSCRRLLNEGRIERYHVWQPTGCMIHWYDLLDFNQCTRLITQSSSTIDKSLIATRKAFNDRIDPGEWLRTLKQEQQRLKQEKQDNRKINFSYVFVGDERLYMIYRTFINTIKYHSNLSRKKSTQVNQKSHQSKQYEQYPFIYKHLKNLTYTNENFILQYYSISTFNDYLYNLLYSWTNNNSIRPHVLIIGLGLYDGIRENATAETIKYFEGNLTRIKQNLLTNLSLTTTIFWFGQPHLSLNEHLFQFSQHSLYQQNEYLNDFIPKLNSYIDRMNSIAHSIFYHTNIYWHSSTLLEEYSSISKENSFLYDDYNDEYFDDFKVSDDDENNHEITNDIERSASNHHLSSSSLTLSSSSTSSSTVTTNTFIPHILSLILDDSDEDSNNNSEIVYYSYLSLKKSHIVLSTPIINSGKIYEFYKLSPFTRHTCVQILLNALCNPLLLPDDGTCCAQVPPLTRLQFIISLILGCSITFFIIYIVYRIRSVFILKRKSHTKLRYGKHPIHDKQQKQHQDNHNSIGNGHCHVSPTCNEDGDEPDQQLLTSNTNGDCSTNHSRSNFSNSTQNQNHSSLLSTGLSRYRFLIPKFLRNLRKKSREHLLPPLLLTTSIATQSSSSSSSNNGNNNNNSSYPSRFYKKQNSLLHFPLTEPIILRTSVKYAFILLYFYLADRTDFLMKENSHFSRIAFFLPLTYIGILGIFFHDKYLNKTSSNRSSPNQTPMTTSPNSNSTFSPLHMNDYEQIQSHSDSNDDNSSTSNNTLITNGNLNNSFLNKEQINEMQGWMMVILLAYQMTDASGKSLVLSMCIQLLISAYLFLSAYNHFHYYWTTGNYQFLPFIQMLFKYNFLTITLCLLMNRHYQTYYYPPLISFYFTLMYVILACIPPRICSESVKERPIHFIYLLLKFLLMGILVTILSMSAYLFEKIFTFHLWNYLFTTSTITSSLAAYVQQLDQSDLSHNGLHQLHSLLIHDKNSLYYNEYNTLLDYIAGSGQGIVGPVSMNGISLNDKQYLYSNLHRYNMNSTTHIYYDRNGTINDWYHRWNLDRYTVLYGMCFAFLILFIENHDTYKILGIKRKQYQQLISKLKKIFCLFSLLGLIIYFIVLFLCSNKAICDEIHSYIVIVPIVSYILLRNIPTFLRQHYSPFFSWFGNISLELFVAQYHIWLIANGHGTLTVIPRMPTLNLLITTFIFICCCHELHNITNILTPVFVPNDCKCFIRNCLIYLLIIIVSSYMFS